MSLAIAVLIFFGMTVLWAVLPFLPGLIEWREKRDTEPLDVSMDSEVDIRHFARGFRSYIDANLETYITACRLMNRSIEGMLKDGSPYLVLGNGDTLALTDSEQQSRFVERMILSCGDLNLPQETMFLPEIYAAGSIRGGGRNIYRAMLAERDIYLGGESMSLRWIHAVGVFHAKPRCILHGRASSDSVIRLEGECRFERLNAPRIEFGEVPGILNGGAGENARPLLKAEDVANIIDAKAGRWLIKGALSVRSGMLLHTDLVVIGPIRIGSGTRIIGSIKSHKDLHLGEGVEVEGSVVSGRNVNIAAGCRIHGPVIAERDIRIGPQCRIGSHEHPTTVSARDVYVTRGTVVHGTVWAHRNGRLGFVSKGL